MTKKKMDNPMEFLQETGLLFEMNRNVLHPLGLSLEFNEGQTWIIDAREEPEGILYSDEVFLEELGKYGEFMESFGMKKMMERLEAVGYLTQEVPDPYFQKKGVELVLEIPETDTMPRTVRVFRVPFDWFKNFTHGWFDMNPVQFLMSYDNGMVEHVYENARTHDCILEEKDIDID